jgi:hypothetical protein
MAKRSKPRPSKREKKMAGNIIEQTFPDGITRKMMEMDFKSEKEDWNVYRLSDGSVVKLRVIPALIYRVLDNSGQPAFTPEGDPFILSRNTIQVFTANQ